MLVRKWKMYAKRGGWARWVPCFVFCAIARSSFSPALSYSLAPRLESLTTRYLARLTRLTRSPAHPNLQRHHLD